MIQRKSATRPTQDYSTNSMPSQADEEWFYSHYDDHPTSQSIKQPLSFQKRYSADPIPDLETFSVNELLRQEFPPTHYIIPGLLAEGLTLLFARPKTGKSMVSLSIGLYLCKEYEKQMLGSALYLSLDDPDHARLQERTRSILQGQPVNDHLWFATEARPIDTGLVTQLDRYCDRQPDCRLIIVDIYNVVKPKNKGDDIYQNDSMALRPLKDFALRRHVAVLLVHHTRKKVDVEDWTNNINGSTGLLGACDSIWMLDRRRNSQEMILHFTSRHQQIGEGEMTLQLDDLSAPWKRNDEEEDRASTTEREILVVLEANTGPMAPKAIAACAGLKPKTISRLCLRLKDKGLVTHTTYGAYELRQSTTTTTKYDKPESEVNPVSASSTTKTTDISPNIDICRSVVVETNTEVEPEKSTTSTTNVVVLSAIDKNSYIICSSCGHEIPPQFKKYQDKLYFWCERPECGAMFDDTQARQARRK